MTKTIVKLIHGSHLYKTNGHNSDMDYIAQNNKFSLGEELSIVKSKLIKYKQSSFPDWKAIHHAIRAGYQLKSIYENGDFSYPLPQTKLLMKIKNGELDWMSETQPLLESLIDEVMMLSSKSRFPENLDTKFWYDIVLQEHEKIVRS